MEILCILLTLYWIVLIASIIISYALAAGWHPTGPMHALVDAVYRVTDPVFGLVRGLLPPLRFGGMALDLSPIIIFIVIGIVRAYVCRA